MSNHCLKNAKPWVLSLETGSLKDEGGNDSILRGDRRICPLTLPSKVGQGRVFRWTEVTVRGVPDSSEENVLTQQGKGAERRGSSNVVVLLWCGRLSPGFHICQARPLLLSYTLSPHFLFRDRVSLSCPELEFLSFLPVSSKWLRWQAGLCNRNHALWF